MRKNQLVSLFICTCLCVAKPVFYYDESPTQGLDNATLVTSLRFADVMMHLNELQRIATAANGTRASGTSGFNRTLDYLTGYLSKKTNFKITTSFFTARDPTLASTPILLSSIGGTVTNHTYASTSITGEFFRVRYSTSTNSSDFLPLTFIPNGGCNVTDWLTTNSPVKEHAVLLRRGKCTFMEQGALAARFHAKVLLLYNDGTSVDRLSPMNVNLGQNNTIPALSLSFALGERLAHATRDFANNVSVHIEIALFDERPFPVGNICADTPTGDPAQTIVIGSHTDSVRAGPGLNDDGEFSRELKSKILANILF